MATQDMNSYRKVNEALITGGQPTEAQLKDAAAEGFEAVFSRLKETKTLLHRAANFRATAFSSQYVLKHLGWSEEQAETFR